MGSGLVRGEEAYLRDYWNVGDFLVVVTGWVEKEMEGQGINLTALRTLRILRPLRSITHIQGMRIIFLSLLGSIRLLLSSMALLLFFFVVTSITSLQLFMGVLRSRCMDLDTGVVSQDDASVCGSQACNPGQVCVTGLDNPVSGTVHFDNLLIAMVTVFQSVTLEGWSDNMNALQRAEGMLMCLFFVPMVFLGAYFFMNLTLVAMKASVPLTQFSHAMDEVKHRSSRKSEINDLIQSEDILFFTKQSFPQDFRSSSPTLIIKEETSGRPSGHNSFYKRVNMSIDRGEEDVEVSNLSVDQMLSGKDVKNSGKNRLESEENSQNSVIFPSFSPLKAVSDQPSPETVCKDRKSADRRVIPTETISVRVSSAWILEIPSKSDIFPSVFPLQLSKIGSQSLFSDRRDSEKDRKKPEFKHFLVLSHKTSTSEAFVRLHPGSNSSLSVISV